MQGSAASSSDQEGPRACECCSSEPEGSVLRSRLIAARREFIDAVVVADYDLAEPSGWSSECGDPRFVSAQVDASDEAAVAALLGAAPMRRA